MMALAVSEEVTPAPLQPPWLEEEFRPNRPSVLALKYPFDLA